MIVLTLVWPIVQPMQLHAADFYWDSNGVDGDNVLDGNGLGGTGTWDTATPLWWPVPAGVDVVYGNGTNDRAIFTGPVGSAPSLVTLTSGIQANNLSFFRDGYTLTGGDLTLSGSIPSIKVNHGDSARINSQVLGTNGLIKTGGGALRLGNAANSYTGVTRINGGSIVIGSNGALGMDTSAVVVAGNATRGFTSGQLVLDGTAGAVTLSRSLSLQGFGPNSDRSGALASVRNNTISGAISSGVGNVNTRINSAAGLLTMSGGLDVGGVAATTITQFGTVNQAGANNYAITGPLTGVGILEKSGSGTLILNPTDSSGFSGTLRISSSANNNISSVRITSNGTLGSRTASTNQAVIDLNGGTLEVRMDAPIVQVAGGTNANSYLRLSSSIFLDHSVGGTAINGVANFGSLSYDANLTSTWNGRNGYGAGSGTLTGS